MSASTAWRQQGLISVWRYVENSRNFPGWHLSADQAGFGSLASLVDALHADGMTAVRTVDLQPPSAAVLAVPNNGTSAISAASRLRLAFASSPEEWSFSESSAALQVSFGEAWHPVLRDALLRARLGEGDFSIGKRGGERLWFWWRTNSSA